MKIVSILVSNFKFYVYSCKCKLYIQRSCVKKKSQKKPNKSGNSTAKIPNTYRRTNRKVVVPIVVIPTTIFLQNNYQVHKKEEIIISQQSIFITLDFLLVLLHKYLLVFCQYFYTPTRLHSVSGYYYMYRMIWRINYLNQSYLMIVCPG